MSTLVVVAFVAGAFACLLAVVVARASGTRGNRWLAALLVCEGILQATAVLDDIHPLLDLVSIVAAALVPPLALCILRTLNTRAVGWIRRRGAVAGLFFVSGAMVILASSISLGSAYVDASLEEGPLAFASFVAILMYVAFAYIFSLVASLLAFRRSERGTAARAKAKAFAIAFGTRDASVASFLVAIVLAEALGFRIQVQFDYVPALGTIAYVLLLAYGILRTQLFDIDLKIKVGISRGTVVSLGLVGVFVAAKVTETYLNQTVGFVAGSIVAGLLLFMAPRLNKLGDKVANAALPGVQQTPEYLAVRKLEVYRAAVETAWEDGAISMQDRAILDRLREKLEITGGEAFEVESSVTILLRARAAASTPAVV